MGFLRLSVLHSHVHSFAQPTHSMTDNQTERERETVRTTACGCAMLYAAVFDYGIRSVASVFSENLNGSSDQMETRVRIPDHMEGSLQINQVCRLI